MKFNKWSMERIQRGKKILTSRKNFTPDDPHVRRAWGPVPWWFIRDYLYQLEGADSPEELQRVINQIFRRRVSDHEVFYVHEIIPEKVEK